MREHCIISRVAGDKQKNFVLRLDAQTMEAVERWAEDEFRSTQGQLQWIIAEALHRAGRAPKKPPVKPVKKEEIAEKPEKGMPEKGMPEMPEKE